MTANRATLEAQIESMREDIGSAMSDLDWKVGEIDAFTVTSPALAQDAYDLALQAADIAQRVTSKLNVLAGKYTELKREIPQPFRVPAFRRDVITALRSAGIEVEVMP